MHGGTPIPSSSSAPLSESQGSLAHMLVISLIAAVGGLLFGFDTAVISGAIPFLEKQFDLDALWLGWVVSSALLGCIAGAMVAGTLSDRYGRRPVLLLSAVLFLVSAIWCAFAGSAASLVAARVTGGLGIGIASMMSPLYIAEFARPDLRGRLVALYQFAITLGILAAYFSNAFLHEFSLHRPEWILPASWLSRIFFDEIWRGMFFVGAVPSGAFFLLLLTVPESPRWLVEMGRLPQALAVLAKLRGEKAAAAEVEDIRVTVAGESNSLLQLLEPRWRIPLLLGILLPFFCQVSGINSIIYYGPKIFEEAGFSLGSSLGGQVAVGIVLSAFTLLAMWKVDSLGRRFLLLTGIAGCFLSLVLVGAFFHFGITSGAGLLVLISMFLAFFAFSLGPVPWILISEIFPTSIRGRAMSIGTFVVWVSCAAVSQAFPWLLQHLGPAGTFWLFAALTAPGFFVVWRLLPETKGKTLEQIERDWQ